MRRAVMLRTDAVLVAGVLAGLACGPAFDASPGDEASDAGGCPIVQPLDRRSALRGKCVVTQRACGSCHEPKEGGEETLSGRLEPLAGTSAYPSNLTPDEATGLGEWTSDEIVRAIRVSFDRHGRALCYFMPRYDRLDDDDAYAIAHYLKSLPAVTRPVPPSTCPPKVLGDAGAD